MAATAVAAAPSAAEVARARTELQKYAQEQQVEKIIEDMLQGLLTARPANPRQWLLNLLDRQRANESEELSDFELHRLFAVTRRITSEIMPQVTIEIVISETLKLLNCDRVSLFLYDKRMNKLRLYASNLPTPIMVSKGQGIAGSVFNQLQNVNIPDCYQDSRFDKSFDVQTGYVTRSLLAVPIVDYEGAAAGVIQAINKLPGGSPPPSAEPVGSHAVPFERNDEKILTHLTQHVAIALRNADVYREAITASERSQGLLNTIQSLSQDLGTQSMLLTITMHAGKIVSAQRATVFLVDEAAEQLWSVSTDTGAEIRIPKRAGIAGQCCCEGAVINIPDAYADPRFNQEVDKKTGFRTQSILAIPMRDDDSGTGQAMAKRKSLKGGDLGNVSEDDPRGASRAVIGVIQMINKVSYDGQLAIFDESDVEVMELFAKFVGPKLASNSMLSRRAGEGKPSGEKNEGALALGKRSELDDRGARLAPPRSPAGPGALGAFAEGEEDEAEGEEGASH